MSAARGTKAELACRRIVLRGTPLSGGTERERHRAFDDDLAVDTRRAFQQSHAAAEPQDYGFDDDDVARMHGPPEADALDAHEKDQALAVFRLRENHDRAHLRDRFGEDRRRQRRRLVVAVREIPLVERDVLDADDPLVDFELRDAIDEQERIPVRAGSVRSPRSRGAGSNPCNDEIILVPMDLDVLIVGAGPTGLVLALWLTRLGVRVRIVDKTAEPGTTSRAAVGATLVCMASRGRGGVPATLVPADYGRGPEPVPLRADLSAGRARASVDRSLAEAGVNVERQTELVSFEEANGRVTRVLKRRMEPWRPAKRPTSPAATARIPSCARR